MEGGAAGRVHICEVPCEKGIAQSEPLKHKCSPFGLDALPFAPYSVNQEITVRVGALHGVCNLTDYLSKVMGLYDSKKHTHLPISKSSRALMLECTLKPAPKSSKKSKKAKVVPSPIYMVYISIDW